MPDTTLDTKDKTVNKKEKKSLPVGGDKQWAYAYTKHIVYQLVSDRCYEKQHSDGGVEVTVERRWLQF